MRNLPLFFQSNELGQVAFADSRHADKLIHYNSSIASANLNENFYSEFYANNVNPLRKTREIQFLSLIKKIKPFLNLNSSEKKTLLDIGCGQGDFVNLIQQKHSDQLEVFGIEPSISKETACIKKLSLDALEKSQELPHRYNVLTLFDVFEHFPDPMDRLEQFSSLLRDDGKLILMVPNKDSLLYRVAKFLNSILPKISEKIFARLYQVNYPPPHYYYYNAASLTSLLKPLFEIEYVGYETQLPFAGIPTRLWGINKTLKPFFIVLAVIYRLFSPFSLNDSLVIIAKKRQVG